MTKMHTNLSMHKELQRGLCKGGQYSMYSMAWQVTAQRCVQRWQSLARFAHSGITTEALLRCAQQGAALSMQQDSVLDSRTCHSVNLARSKTHAMAKHRLAYRGSVTSMAEDQLWNRSACPFLQARLRSGTSGGCLLQVPHTHSPVFPSTC